MAFEFKLPDIGEGVTEGEIVKWLVKAGDTVKEDQPIVEVMTDKATVEIASPKSGTIESLLAKDGDMIQVGKGLVMINEGGASASAQGSKAQAADETAAKKPATEQAKSPEGDQRPQASTAAPTKSAPAAQPMQASSSNGSSNASSVLASPATRKMAREHGIDLASVQGSGDLGRVTRDDVEKSMGAPKAMGATSAGAPSAAPSAPKQLLNIPRAAATSNAKHEERIPVRGIRKKIIENMRISVDHAAHFTHMDELDATNLVDLRNSLKDEAEKYGVKLNYLPFLVKAVCMALKKFPRINGTYDEEKNEIVIKHYYNMGIAVATKDNDLVVPVIQNADQKNILEIAAEIKDLATKAQTNKLGPNDFQNGTFTITSLGPLAGTYATPIINYPELGILGFFAIKEKPVVRDGQIVIRSMATMAISLDHRIVDGYLGAQFTKALIEYLENPSAMLLFTA
jgi:pyruvate dehydrogenase E2 component (dihydrolipoamide acetyltransferase)